VTRWLGTAALVLCAAAPAVAQPLFGPPQDPLAGSRVFGAKGCARCHSVSGVGGKVGPDLARTTRPRSFHDLAAALWNHAPRMADRMRQLAIARPRLDGRESGDLVAFLFSVSYFDRPGNAETGRRLFTTKRCIVCHQVAGRGGVVGPSLDGLKQQTTPIALATAMWNHGPQMAEVMKAKGIIRPTFTGSDLRDLLAYIGSASLPLSDEPLYVLPGNPESGRQLFADKRCLGCHGVGGAGGKGGPDLAERRRGGTPADFAAAMWNKAPSMTAAMQSAAVPPPELRPAEMADIVAYLYAVRYLAPGGDPRKGLAVATAKGCLGCHGSGERGKAAGDLGRARGVDTVGGMLAALWNHSFIGDPRPAGGGRAPWGALSADEMADLLAFLQSPARSR
jgi:mono/diheme cytochrome c family protein